MDKSPSSPVASILNFPFHQPCLFFWLLSCKQPDPTFGNHLFCKLLLRCPGQVRLEESENQSDFEFVIIYEGKIIGGCDVDLSHSEDHSYATLGWIINKQYRKRGFASEAAAALLDFAFTRLNVQKVYAQCDCKNCASFGVMKKIGMKLVDDKGTRTYPKTGITSGEFTCLITKEEWKNESFIF